MTYKLALLELPVGGGKAVVLADPRTQKTEQLLAAIGRAVARLSGRFIVATDVGTTAADLDVIGRSTMWVSRDSSPSGEGAEATAYGVFVGLRVAVRRRLGRGDLDGVRVAVQGLGRVGLALARRLAAAGARLSVADLDGSRCARLETECGATIVAPDRIVDQDVDVLAPCALADTIDERTLPRLRCRVIAGSANNQLARPELADELARREILWAPDIVINGGASILSASNVSVDAGGSTALRARLDVIGALLDGILDRAEREHTSPLVAAERTARERFAAMGGRP
jgi:leucine dehydrogenase